ncbi:MAG: hypothetical protein HYU27_01755 [Acidobacteria bacterium]|nr:hypothetical protein [Acidobacteriota bacterium]
MTARVPWRVVGHAFIPALQVLAPHRTNSPRHFHIRVVFTTFEDTKAALKAAADLSAGLSAGIDLVVPHIVPYPLPLARPSISVSFTLRRLCQLAADTGLELSIFVYFCRDALQTLLQVLEPHSLIVIGTRRRWFSTKRERLAKALRKNGHEVVLARR